MSEDFPRSTGLTIDQLKYRKELLPSVQNLEQFAGVEKNGDSLPKNLRREEGQLERAHYILDKSEQVKRKLQETLTQNEYDYFLRTRNRDEVLQLLGDLADVGNLDVFANFYFGTGGDTQRAVTVPEKKPDPTLPKWLTNPVGWIDDQVKDAVRDLTGDTRD